jgi:alkylmercury lyase
VTHRLSRDQLERLGDAVCGSQPSLGGDGRQAAGAVYRILGAGRPVTAARLAAALGWEHARAERMLGRLPNVDLDADGAVVGFGGLTLRPTPHRIMFHGQVRYAWCAWDTLFLPVALDGEVEVTARCPQTGRTVTLTVAPTGVRHREPDGVVVSFVQPDAVDAGDLRGSLCGAVHFLADATAAGDWARQAADSLVLDLDDAFELGRRMILERCDPTQNRHAPTSPE